jgi:hypothetical protein
MVAVMTLTRPASQSACAASRGPGSMSAGRPGHTQVGALCGGCRACGARRASHSGAACAAPHAEPNKASTRIAKLRPSSRQPQGSRTHRPARKHDIIKSSRTRVIEGGVEACGAQLGSHGLALLAARSRTRERHRAAVSRPTRVQRSHPCHAIRIPCPCCLPRALQSRHATRPAVRRRTPYVPRETVHDAALAAGVVAADPRHDGGHGLGGGGRLGPHLWRVRGDIGAAAQRTSAGRKRARRATLPYVHCTASSKLGRFCKGV